MKWNPKRLWQVGFFCALIFLGAPALRAQTEVSKEYQIKAVFLFNFAQFVEWPASAFPDAQTPLTIGVLGDDPFGNYLDETVHGEKINGRSFAIEHYSRVEDVKNCQILFISRSENKKLDEIISELKGRNILSVSDAQNFSESGGTIGFVTTAQNKIHFHINLDAAKNSNLTISSKLLRLAEIVKTEK